MNNPNSTDITKQSVGIDVACEILEVRFATKTSQGHMNFPHARSFPNTAKGFSMLLEWAGQRAICEHPIWFIMEATGSYYEQLAWFLYQAQQQVCVLVPHRAKHYAQSLPKASKTDAIDAQKLARYGLERHLSAWKPGHPKLRQIKQLLRERASWSTDHTRLSNRIHAASRAYNHPESSITRWKAELCRMEEHMDQIEEEVHELLQHMPDIAKKVHRIAQVKGLRWLSVLITVCETNGFALIKNRQQLASFVGLDVVLDESGNKKGATKISKQGNAYIRGALYMPILSIIQYNQALKAFYERIARKNPTNKQIAVIAVMRKVVLLIYSLWKSGQEYDPEFHYQQITKAG